MTIGLALVIVLSVLVIALGFVVYHLTTRVSSLETAIDGGLRTPERALNSQEFADRFATALERAALARDLGDGLALFLAADCSRSAELLDSIANLSTGRDVTLVFKDTLPEARWPTDIAVRTDLGPRFEAAGVVATPFAMSIRDGRVTDARLIGNDAALLEMLGSNPQAKPEPTPLEVD